MSRALLQQALDALSADDHFGDYRDLCAALREALAAPQPKPVAWQFRWTNPGNNPHADPLEMTWKPVAPKYNDIADEVANLRSYRFDSKPCYEVRALYAAPPAAPAPADWGTPHDVSGAPWPVDAPAPAVPAVAVPFPLTAQEIKDIARSTGHVTHDQAWEIAELLVGGVVSAAPAVPAVCDGGTCGLGGYCANCPKQSAAPAVRGPLTKEQIIEIRKATPLFTSGVPWENSLAFARAIEKHHGIGGGGK